MNDNGISVSVEELTKRFGDFTAVDGISFAARRGGSIALIAARARSRGKIPHGLLLINNSRGAAGSE